jgi:hypothetical protein
VGMNEKACSEASDAFYLSEEDLCRRREFAPHVGEFRLSKGSPTDEARDGPSNLREFRAQIEARKLLAGLVGIGVGG